MIDIIRTAKNQSFKKPVQQSLQESFVRVSELAEDFVNGKNHFFSEEKSKQGCWNCSAVRTGMDDVDILILLEDFYSTEKCRKHESQSTFSRPIDGNMGMVFTFKKFGIKT
jgi:hypothetical protein